MPPKVERLKSKKKLFHILLHNLFFMIVFENGSSVCKHSIRRMLASTPMSNIRRRIYENVVLKRWQNQITWISFNAIINWCEYCKSGSKQKKKKMTEKDSIWREKNKMLTYYSIKFQLCSMAKPFRLHFLGNNITIWWAHQHQKKISLFQTFLFNVDHIHFRVEWKFPSNLQLKWQ